MRAARLTSIPASNLELADVADPVPGFDDMAIDVTACGVCGTDLHIMAGDSYRPSLPFTLGHEPVGVVGRVGPSVDRAWIGRRVALTLFIGDGTCHYCRSGDERLCPNLAGIVGVLRFPGGFAQRLSFPAGLAIAIPEGLGDSEAASLVDGGATAANAARTLEEREITMGRQGRRDTAVIIGAGPIGLIVAELLLHSGRPSVLVQHSELRRAQARSMGHQVVADLAEVDDAISAVIDCAGAPGSVAWAVANLQPQGIFVAAGYGPAPALDTALVARKELVITGVRSGRRADLAQILTLAASGAIRLPPISEYPLSEINAAIADLRAHNVPGKVVIRP